MKKYLVLNAKNALVQDSIAIEIEPTAEYINKLIDVYKPLLPMHIRNAGISAVTKTDLQYLILAAFDLLSTDKETIERGLNSLQLLFNKSADYYRVAYTIPEKPLISKRTPKDDKAKLFFDKEYNP